MFHIDVTMEDSRVIAIESPHHHTDTCDDIMADVQFHCTSEKPFFKRMKMLDIMKVLTMGFSLDGESDIAVTYRDARILIDDVPAACRPIP